MKLFKNSNSVDSINSQLIDLYGIDTITGDPIWRVQWSEYTEKRITKFTEAGVELLHPALIEHRKYNYIRDRWVLENLVLVPDYQQAELAGIKISYEPIWTFEDKDDNPVFPTLIGCQFIINLIQSVRGKSNMAKYINNEEGTKEEIEKSTAQIYEELYGNETPVTDALAYKTGVVNPYWGRERP